jgi:hypothetical protein
VDPRTGACFGGDSPKNRQFGNLGGNALRAPNFTWSDFYLSKWFPLTEPLKLRFDVQFFNVFRLRDDDRSPTRLCTLPDGVDQFPYSREMMIVVFGGKIQMVHESHRRLQARVRNGSSK